MARIWITMAFLGIIMASFCGCGGSEGAQISRARLIGNENLKLNKQLADKDIQIKDLEKKIEGLEAEKTKISQDCGDMNFNVMQIVAETEKRNAELTAENQALKEKLNLATN